MDASSLIGAVLGSIGVLVSATVAAWVALRSKRLDHELERTKLWVSTYEKLLFENRLPGYKSLWALTEKTSRQNVLQLSPEAAAQLASEITRWYYQDGGMLMAAETRDAFFEAREHLRTYSSNQVSELVQAFSTLRTSMCEDLKSRRGPGFSERGVGAIEPGSKGSKS